MRNQQGKGYYVIARTQSVAWHSNKEEAEATARFLNYRGGAHYTVEAATNSLAPLYNQRDIAGQAESLHGLTGEETVEALGLDEFEAWCLAALKLGDKALFTTIEVTRVR